MSYAHTHPNLYILIHEHYHLHSSLSLYFLIFTYSLPMKNWNPETLQSLSLCFFNTFSPVSESRWEAESQLLKASVQPNYGLAVLRIVNEPNLDENTRMAAAINFKNHLRDQWAVSMSNSEKEQIKSQIVSLIISTNSTPRIQAQLREALAVSSSVIHRKRRRAPITSPLMVFYVPLNLSLRNFVTKIIAKILRLICNIVWSISLHLY